MRKIIPKKKKSTVANISNLRTQKKMTYGHAAILHLRANEEIYIGDQNKGFMKKGRVTPLVNRVWSGVAALLSFL